MHGQLDGADPCPDEESLALFGERRLPPDRAARLAAHTEQCPHCRRLIALLARLSTSGRLELPPGGGK